MSLFSSTSPKDSEVIPFYLPASNPATQVDKLIFAAYREAKPYLTIFLSSKSNIFQRMAMLEMSYFFALTTIKFLEQLRGKDLSLYVLALDRYITENLHEELTFEIKCNHQIALNFLEDRKEIFEEEIYSVKSPTYNPVLLMALFLRIPVIETSLIAGHVLKAEETNDPFYSHILRNQFLQVLQKSISSIESTIKLL